MKFRSIVVCASALLILGVSAGCKTKRTTTKKRSMDPLLNKFASNFDVGEEGYMVSGERSEYEARKITDAGKLGAKRFETSEAKKKAFEGGEEFQAGMYRGDKRKAFGGETPTYETYSSELGGQVSGMREMKPIEGGTYQTGTDPVSGETIRTNEDRVVSGRRETMPEPTIIESGSGPITIDEVKALLER